MKKYFSLILALVTILIFVGLVAKNESHLHHSKSIFIELRPVDPRSILQGDYMALAYELNLQSLKALAGSESEALDRVIFNHSSVPAKVILDSQNRVVRTILDTNNSFAGQSLILKNPENRLQALYPASRSFLFAEGLAQCYQKAKYAEFKVNTKGEAILFDLRGEGLQPLNCKQQKNWWEGTI
ncbi:GDYXXLXY domain-containing protein [Acinetobacter oleivorans]|uniref:GDYXXLXY domain-containing protein n=1 Tax=Acinetobacter oleivorans TaxID=1148157 RepID=UPI00190190A4|nr:GDYXXLXY domain-containing protein [Acinetobacter oleivorans]MBJ9741290.1 GDYXXLXY domain-containing protein [Acinetobacter oleivorans]MCU4412052.1 GDYXXLXY domain-containing protein [Acinetobacter oleivorans]